MFAILCTAVLRLASDFNLEHESSFRRFQVCVEVASEAESWGVDPALAVAVAYEESRFDLDARSPAGAHGVLQVIPRYWCPRGRLRGCNLLTAGIRALSHYTIRFDRLPVALARYNGGKFHPSSRSYWYVNRVLAFYERLQFFVEADYRLSGAIEDLLAD